MQTAGLPEAATWGHDPPAIAPADLVLQLHLQVEAGVQDYKVLLEPPDPCMSREGFRRVSAVIPLPATLFDQLMNGSTGYRAHYYVGVDCGERFNRALVEAVAPELVRADWLYADRCDPVFVRSSLLGPFSKLWFTTDLTDPSANDWLIDLPERLRAPRWVAYWRHQPGPRKGLLAPLPENAAILLNGTFVNDSSECHDLKPGRSGELFDCGWT